MVYSIVSMLRMMQLTSIFHCIHLPAKFEELGTGGTRISLPVSCLGW